MSKSLMRRLEGAEERLAGAGRVHVLTIPAHLCDDKGAIERAKAEQGIEVGPRDLLVIIKQQGYEPGEQG